jgi:DNA-binding NarL/FixJ family response regulator
VRVLLADDHTTFREGLARVLSSYGGMQVVAQVPNDSEKALRLAGELEPDVVVKQVRLPVDHKGIWASRIVIVRAPSAGTLGSVHILPSFGWAGVRLGAPDVLNDLPLRPNDTQDHFDINL